MESPVAVLGTCAVGACPVGVGESVHQEGVDGAASLVVVAPAAPGGSGAAGASGGATSDDLTSVFSEDDRAKWRDIVTHDSTFRTMIESAQTTEDVESAVSQVTF